MTNKEAVLKYLKSYKEFIPAFMANKEWEGYWFGSEVGKACRRLFKAGVLDRKWTEKSGRLYKAYYLK